MITEIFSIFILDMYRYKKKTFANLELKILHEKETFIFQNIYIKKFI